MSEIINRDKFMPEMHLRQLSAMGQPGFMCSACGPFTKKQRKSWKIKETWHSRCIYQNKLDKACFQHDMAYRDFKDLPRRAASGQVLCNKAFNIVKNPNYGGTQTCFNGL